MYTWGLGRRKTSVARVRIKSGSGNVSINGKPMDKYFDSASSIEMATMPLTALGIQDKYDVWVNAKGGGLVGQAGAMMMGVARALKDENETYEEELRNQGFLSRDPRMKERKKPGQRGARASFQFSKR